MASDHEVAAVVSVYVTSSTMEEAERLARRVLDLRLAACGNAFPIRSWFWWEGTVEEAAEVALILKTRADLVEALTAEIRAAHSYSLPCVVAWPIEAGDPSYLAWIAAEARGRASRAREGKASSGP